MNCKPNDLAVVVSGEPEINIGRIVRVTTLIPTPYGLLWCYEGDLVSLGGGRCSAVGAETLRPLRPDEGQDQTLTWAGLPASVQETEAADVAL